jgi:transposase
MIIIGADYHPGFQQIALVDTDIGEFRERRLQHRQEAEKFYRELAAQGMQVRVGVESSGQARWFERLLSELSGTGAIGGLERTAASAGTHHETRQLSVALLAGGSGASHGTQRSGMAQQVFFHLAMRR